MDTESLFVLLSSVLNVALLLGALMFRKRILRALGKMLFAGALGHLGATYFEETDVSTPDGKKTRLTRPNASAGALLGKYGPGIASWGMDWASKNVKIKLPPLSLPEGMDLKAAGVAALTQKAMSGKKLKIEDAIPAILGYVMDYIQPMLQGLGGKAPAAKEAVNPFLKDLTQ